MKVKKEKSVKQKKYTTDGRVVLYEFNLMKFLVLVGIIIFLLCTYFGLKTVTKAITINQTNLSSMALVEEDYTETVDKEQTGEDNEEIVDEVVDEETSELEKEQTGTDQEEIFIEDQNVEINQEGNTLEETNTDVVESEELINTDESLADDTTDIEKNINSDIALISDEDEVDLTSKYWCLSDVCVHLSMEYESDENESVIRGAMISLWYTGYEKVEEKFVENGSTCYFKDIDWCKYQYFDVEGVEDSKYIMYKWGTSCEDDTTYYTLYITIKEEEKGPTQGEETEEITQNKFLKAVKIWNDYDNIDNSRPEEITFAVESRIRILGPAEEPISLGPESDMYKEEGVLKYDQWKILNPDDYKCLLKDMENSKTEWTDWEEKCEISIQCSEDNKQNIEIFNGCGNSCLLFVRAKYGFLGVTNGGKYYVQMEYRVVEKTVPEGYTSETQTLDDGTYQITNSYNPTISVTGKITWEDYKNADNTRPEKMIIRLYKNDEYLSEVEVSPDENEEWNFQFEDLKKYDENGEEYKYTIKTDDLNFYVSSDDGNYHIHEVYVAKVDVSVSKIWNDNSNQDGKRDNYAITITGTVGDEEVYTNTQELDKDTLEYTWENLAKYHNETEITYTVDETNIPEGYTKEIAGDQQIGFTITNTYMAKENVLDGEEPGEDQNNETQIKEDSLNPITGDLIIIAVVVLVIATLGLIITIKIRKKNKE